ncbi:hypothetical protein DSO57_1003789 [Entomophthora muscae]|uniref:Uncharacterized protein n=1 Tax=Entomophthora muscae TaxID=34485 RepID=A0ACC2UHR5_9FUNG|nr:hypothetical protein DSO57_1003789 [Entomophthora muscae]
MSQLPHIFYPSPGDKESYCLGCREFASSKSAQEEWEKVTRHLEMMNRGREFIGGEFARLLQDWYWPTEGLAPAEVQVYGGDACLVIGKVLEEFALMQAKYKLLTNHSPLLENDNSSKWSLATTQDTLWGLVTRNPTRAQHGGLSPAVWEGW